LAQAYPDVVCELDYRTPCVQCATPGL